MGMNLSDRSAALVLPCSDIAAGLQFYIEQLGFRLDAIIPADEPRLAMLSGHGMRIRLERSADAALATIELDATDARFGQERNGEELVSPDGTRIRLVGDSSAIEVPPLLALDIIVQSADSSPWRTGRAGMQY